MNLRRLYDLGRVLRRTGATVLASLSDGALVLANCSSMGSAAERANSSAAVDANSRATTIALADGDATIVTTTARSPARIPATETDE